MFLLLLSIGVFLLCTPCLVYSSSDASPEDIFRSALADGVGCATNCSEEFIISSFPTSLCPDRSVNCICTTNSMSGFTFGEGLLRCILSSCPSDVIDTAGEVAYNICHKVDGAAPKTHATISATRVVGTASATAALSVASLLTPTSTESNTSSDIWPEILTVSSSALISFQTPVPGTGTGMDSIADSDAEQAASSSPTSTSTSTSTSTPAGNGKDSNSLSAGSVVGVSVASGLSGFFLIGIALFLWRRKIKHKREEEKEANNSNYFEIGGVMSEPLDFRSTPPRPPSPGPQPPSRPPTGQRLVREQETSRLMWPLEPRLRPPNPAVIVTSGDDGYGGDGRGVDGLGGVAYGTPPEYDVENSPRTHRSSQRTLSELLPDKPELYPEPLRVGPQNMATPRSETTTFEEDVARPRSFRYPSFSRLIGPRPYVKRPMPGLPSNPRAMLSSKSQDHLPAKRIPDPARMRSPELMRPVYLNPEQSAQYADRLSEMNDGPDCERKNRFYNPTLHLSQSADNLNTILEPPDHTNHRTSRHSGSFKPLSPVREAKTPSRNGSNSSLQDDHYHHHNHHQPASSPIPSPVRYPQVPYSTPTGTPDPAREIVSRPRLVRQHDIKRVEIRRGKPQAKEASAPYSPDDLWKENTNSRRNSVADYSASCCVSAAPTPQIPQTQTPQTPGTWNTNRLSGDGNHNNNINNNNFGHPVEKTITRKPVKKQSPLEHNLTPSRQGGDLILRVD